MPGQYFSRLLYSALRYADRLARIGIIVVRPPWAGCEFLTELTAPAHFVVINKGARQFYLSSDTR